jgi:hypothetical protein
MDDKKLSDAVNRSGFPLQIALQRLVERTRSDHEWKVIFSEHYWINPPDKCSGFIDLILENGRGDTVFVVECKRVVNCSWIFLIDDMKQTERRHAKGWVTEYADGSFSRFGFEELQVEPVTRQAQYCVVDGQTPKERPMLERIASILVSSTEGFASEEMPRVSNAKNGVLRVYLSVIVTTAKLRVCAFDSELISLSTGEIDGAKYREVPFLRFRKQLGSHREIPNREIPKMHLSAGYREIAAAKESTVFIVNSESFSEFLRRLEVVALGPE